ncbi:hypothetical protein BO71DRAFT_400170 [Aspergillus ellipticus CBS 707.79]|uniref:Uncharacterized protein n=1 Tax=Aspergillus ellipticus CBS 707.79 TaxID=1448320 RepID=A0A319DNL0_9EURO|nr:hypothetical protein BO71DRAFT_400170 [Aspergillus ellipticus CBS 707.79]
MNPSFNPDPSPATRHADPLGAARTGSDGPSSTNILNPQPHTHSLSLTVSRRCRSSIHPWRCPEYSVHRVWTWIPPMQRVPFCRTPKIKQSTGQITLRRPAGLHRESSHYASDGDVRATGDSSTIALQPPREPQHGRGVLCRPVSENVHSGTPI